MIDERSLCQCLPATPETSLLFILFWRSRDLFSSGLYTKLLVKVGFFNQGKSNFRIVKLQYYILKEIYLYNQTSISKFYKLKLKTAAVGVNLHSLMVRFSFMRDCGSIPHGDSTVSTFFSIF